MTVLENLVYTKSHEWVKELEDNTVVIGLTDFAQSELGELVFVNLPEVGDETTAEESFADVESVKAVSDVFCPVSGEVIEVNEELLDAPELINEHPYDAWLVKIANITEKEEFLSAAEYEAFVKSEQA
ncbi:MAG: glycine cleavage system protein GcvH [Lachnospiraceae bacterium]